MGEDHCQPAKEHRRQETEALYTGGLLRWPLYLLAPRTPGTKFDQLQVTGEALVDSGVMDLDTATGFAPTTKLKVLTAGKRSGGGFTGLKDPGLPNSREWYAIYNPLDVTLGTRRA